MKESKSIHKMQPLEVKQKKDLRGAKKDCLHLPWRIPRECAWGLGNAGGIRPKGGVPILSTNEDAPVPMREQAQEEREPVSESNLRALV